MDGAKAKEIQAIFDAALRGGLTEQQVDRLATIDPALVKLALLATARRVAEQGQKIAVLDAEVAALVTQLNGQQPAVAAPLPHPSTPSGQQPVYTKPKTPRRRGKPGARQGHKPARRPEPEHIDRTEEHHVEQCPHCGCRDLVAGNRRRTRTIEDILEDLRTVVAEHVVHASYCPVCKKYVEPPVPDALPKSRLGHRIVAFTCWLHYGLGVTIAQIVAIFRHHLRTHLSAGGLMAIWLRTARILEPWYEQIAHEARTSAVLHADETGCRVNGQTWWLWCFANGQVCYYMIDRSRGSPALEKFFLEAFDGVLVADFWAAYNSVLAADKQRCLVHLLRELEKVDLQKGPRGDGRFEEWHAFAKRLRRLLRDGIRLRKRPDFSPEQQGGRIRRLDARLMDLARATYADPDARRLAGRLLRHCDEIFTFLDYPEVPFDNNLAERMIRPAVCLRHNSQSNRSERGAGVQAVLMSIYLTLKLRGLDPLATITDALRTHVTTGQLPPLPPSAVAGR
jgi:transposase